MARTVEFYLERANSKFEAGFKTMATKQDALSDLNSAFDLLRGRIHTAFLDIPRKERTEAHDGIYWNTASSLHNWRVKHSVAVKAVFPELYCTVDEIEALVELRQAVKAAEVVRVERQADPRTVAIVKTIRDIMEARKAQYARGIELHDIFKGLPVSVNVHWVTNQFGTSYLRAFYYMAGDLTPLNVILAVLDAKSEKQPKGN